MALSFPTSPVAGQVYAAPNGIIYTWNATVGVWTGTDSNSVIPTGTVIWVATITAPVGYLSADGTAVSRSTYAGLFSAIGVTFGAGDGSTTFNVPDLRGEFIRGWDNGRGVDPARAFGSAQVASRATYSTDSRIATPQTAADAYGEDDNGVTVLGTILNNYNTNINQPVNNYAVRSRNVALLGCIKF
jgi:phage-related tail fiber protein